MGFERERFTEGFCALFFTMVGTLSEECIANRKSSAHDECQ